MVWIRILVVTPLVLVTAVLLLSFLALQAVFAGEGRRRPAYDPDLRDHASHADHGGADPVDLGTTGALRRNSAFS